MSRFWYAYDNVGDPNSVTSYSLSTDKPACTTGNKLCTINAASEDPNTIDPLSANIQIYISNLLITGVPQPQNGQKKYVYGKI